VSIVNELFVRASGQRRIEALCFSCPFAFLALFLAGALLACSERPPRAKPNFIIILADDLGYGDLNRSGPGARPGRPLSIAWRPRA
jgi:hypothetical protein